jgi:small subunit ribosomal protein S1
LTEEQMGGTTPEMTAAAVIAEASDETVAAVAADDPATTNPIESPSEAASEAVAAEVAAVAVEEAAAELATEVADAPAAEEAVEATVEEIAAAPAAEEAVEATVEEIAAAPAAEEAVEATVEEIAAAPAAEEAVEATVEEIAAAPAAEDRPEPTTMDELLAEQDADIRSFKHGDVVEGTVVRIDRDEILVDIGAKSEGVVSNRELYGRHAETQPALDVGDVVLVYVLQPESQEGHAVLSLRRAGLERKWRAMQEQFETGAIIEAPVIDHNKGGLIVDCGIRGFVPISQIVDFPRRPQNDQPRDAAQEIAEKLQPYVGRKLRLKILEVNRKANRLILSEKVALYEERREKRDELFSSLQVGQKVSGTVRSIAPFGVFIDLGGIDGLVHKSELSWNKVNNPEAGYKVGDTVEAEVIDINHERGRISLSIRRLQPDPWHSTVADFKVGDVIDGTVTKLVNFGAFVRVRDGLEGLIHISELSHQRVAHPGDVVREGQTLKLKIISLDSERHRLGLSLKQAEEPPARPASSEAPRPRRPREERGYTMADAVQEPEGGIDNTLASAFAQVRQALVANEEAEETTEVADEAAAEAYVAEVVAEEAVTEAVVAEVEAEEAVGEAVVADVVADAAIEEAATAEVTAEAAQAVAELRVEDAAEAIVEAEVATDVARALEAEALVAAVEATEAEEVAEEAAAAAAVAEEVAAEAILDESVPEAEAEAAVEAALEAEEVADETAADAYVAEVVAEEVVSEAVVADVVADAATEEAVEAVAEAALAADAAEEIAADAFVAEVVAEEAEEVADETVADAYVAEEVAEEAVAEAFVAEVVAEETVVEAEVAEKAAEVVEEPVEKASKPAKKR